jgi:serine/threonine-protein kinase
LAIPRTVGKYEILDALGSGGMGTVYRAFDPTLERMVAIKIVYLDRVHDVPPQELAGRFHNEARAVARLNHPAIVTIFDYDDQDPVGAFIAMEYVRGCGIDEYLRQRPELNLEDATSAMLQVLAGLDYAHRQGVIHRDIKPSNLLVTRDGLVKITDFGIAKINPRSQTQTGMLVGTPQYMAPEQYTGAVVDHRCDIHAAGAVLYELLTGSPPYGGTAAQVMYQVCYEAPKAPSSVDASIPKVFDSIVAQALEKRPADRFQSADQFQQALRASWQAVSAEPPSASLSPAARAIATSVSRQPAVPRPAGPPPEARPRSEPQRVPADAPAPQVQAAPQDSPVRTPSSSHPRLEPGHEGSLTAFSREQLTEIERQLLPLVGPMARKLVRDAATTTATKQELYKLLATHLESPEERRRFLLAGERPSTGPVATRPSTDPHGAVRPSLSSRPLTPEATQRAGQLLARYVGPIAASVARQAAQRATDEAQLYSMLAEKVQDAAERERFLNEVRRPP